MNDNRSSKWGCQYNNLLPSDDYFAGDVRDNNANADTDTATDPTSSCRQRHTFSCTSDQQHNRMMILTFANQGVVVSVDGDTDGNIIRQCCEGSCSCDDENSICSNSNSSIDHDDLPEIIELRKALEYLVTVRNIQNIYNSDNKTWQATKTRNHSSTSTSQSCNSNAPTNEESCDNKNDEILYLIPNLVNRILIEHYSTTTSTSTITTRQGQGVLQQADPSQHGKQMTRNQKDQMNQLLLAVIVEFSEPYFVKVLRHRQQAKALLIQQQQQNNSNNGGKKKKRSRKNQELPLSSQFDERAVSWATECIDLMIRPPTASFKLPIRNDNVKYRNEPYYTHNCHGAVGNNNYHIPELDALLAASGPHDGLVAEKLMQNALMHGLQSRRLLQSSGMIDGRNDDTNAS